MFITIALCFCVVESAISAVFVKDSGGNKEFITEVLEESMEFDEYSQYSNEKKREVFKNLIKESIGHVTVANNEGHLVVLFTVPNRIYTFELQNEISAMKDIFEKDYIIANSKLYMYDTMLASKDHEYSLTSDNNFIEESKKYIYKKFFAQWAGYNYKQFSLSREYTSVFNNCSMFIGKIDDQDGAIYQTLLFDGEKVISGMGDLYEPKHAVENKEFISNCISKDYKLDNTEHKKKLEDELVKLISDISSDYEPVVKIRESENKYIVQVLETSFIANLNKDKTIESLDVAEGGINAHSSSLVDNGIISKSAESEVYEKYFTGWSQYKREDFSLSLLINTKFNNIFTRCNVFNGELKSEEMKDFSTNMLLLGDDNGVIVNGKFLPTDFEMLTDNFIKCIKPNFKLNNQENIGLYTLSLIRLDESPDAFIKMYLNKFQKTMNKDSFVLEKDDIRLITNLNSDKSIQSFKVERVDSGRRNGIRR